MHEFIRAEVRGRDTPDPVATMRAAAATSRVALRLRSMLAGRLQHPNATLRAGGPSPTPLPAAPESDGIRAIEWAEVLGGVLEIGHACGPAPPLRGLVAQENVP